MRTVDGGDVYSPTDYDIVDQVSTFMVNPNGTTTPIEFILARSPKYDVTFGFNILASKYEQDGGPPLAALKTEEVNALAGADHVYSVRWEQDQDPAGRLFNFLIVTVGTDDGARTQDVQLRMDSIGTPAAFQKVADAWNRMMALGPTAPEGV